MSAVEIDIDLTSKTFVLKDESKLINSDRRFKYFLTDALKAKFHDDGSIAISFNDDEKEQVLKSIHDAFQKYGVEQIDSERIKQVLLSYYGEKDRFRDFSEKAKGIWNNIIDPVEFKAFNDVVTKAFPKRTLYPQQLLSAFHLAFSQNACNFSVPGAGKTSIVYAAYAYLNSLPPTHPKYVNKLLIIGPLSSFGPWEDEYRECFGRKVYSKRLSGGISKNDRDNYLLSLDSIEDLPQLTLMSYQSVPFNLENLTHFLQRKGNDVMVILDEAHKIKNVEGGTWAQSILSISKYCKARIVLTGTPIPNGYEDIYNLYEFIWPNKEIINYTTYQLKDMSSNRHDTRIDKLISSISPFFIRIKKKDILDPEQFPIQSGPPVLVDMGDTQREIYNFIENKYINYFTGTSNSEVVSMQLTKARFIRLMQVATNPALLKQPLETYFKDQGLSDDLYIDDSEIINKILNYHEIEPVPQKFFVMKKLVSDLIGRNEKVIIWGTFIQNIKELQSFFKKNGIASKILIGETPVERDDLPMPEIETRERIIRTFHEDDSPFKVIIANPFAVAESISLHKACHNAIYFERTFNAANFIQSKDRIHRVGLKPGTKTYYHYILSKNTIDETINTRLNEKEARMLALLESQEIPLIGANMNYDVDLKDDIKAIIRDYVKRSTEV